LASERKKTNHWRGVACDYKGLLAERTLAFEFRMQQLVRAPLRLADYFDGVDDSSSFNIVQVLERVPHQRLDGENKEIDILVQSDEAQGDGNRVAMIEVRDRIQRTGLAAVSKLHTNALDYGKQHNVTVLSAYLSLSGFTEEAKQFCQKSGIGMAEAVRSDRK